MEIEAPFDGLLLGLIAFLASYRVTFAKKLVLFAQEILPPYLEESILNKNYF